MSVTEMTTVTGDQITEIVRDVWGTFLAIDVVPATGEDQGLGGETMTGVVQVTGEWEGSVFVETTSAHAQEAAQAMFAAEPGSLSPDEVGDALGELTNMVGGNIKGLLPAPSKLSLPSVAGGESYTLRVPGAVMLERVLLQVPAGLVRVSLWRA